MSDLADKVVGVFARSKSSDAGDIGNALRQLRRASQLTQKQIAERLGVQQSTISGIERGGDTHISTIRKYVEALGASLRIDARFPADSILAATIRDAFDFEYVHDDQLVFPLLGDEPFRAHRDVVLSVKPQYSEKILAGEKTVELRRRFPVKAPRGTIAYIYSTSPVRAMVGLAGIRKVFKMPVVEIWRRFEDVAKIRKRDFDLYFKGIEEGFALELEEVRSFETPLSLSDLREKFGFEPPQSYLYAKHELRKALKNESAIVSH